MNDTYSDGVSNADYVYTNTYVVVADGHTAADFTWVFGDYPSRDEAISACEAMGCRYRVHVEMI